MRLPLHVSIMASYLFVVGIVGIPTFLYISTIQRRAGRETTVREVEGEVAKLAEWLGLQTEEELPNAAKVLASTTTRRLTVIDAQGQVLADSSVTDRVLDNHLNRPEVMQAMTSSVGLGLHERQSATTGLRTLYAAARFPNRGHTRGLVRIAIPVSTMDATVEASSRFISSASAMSLTAAVVFSLLAALAISRPLRRMAEGARAFAEGDFGYELGVARNDELGDLAQALSALSAQLRRRLLVSGADRAALVALVDDLPIPVMIFDKDGELSVVNGATRTCFQLTPENEGKAIRHMLETPDQQEVLRRVRKDGFTLETTVHSPTNPAQTFRARCTALAAPDGSRQIALMILGKYDQHNLVTVLGEAASLLDTPHPEVARKLRTLAHDAREEQPALAAPSSVSPEEIEGLCLAAIEDARRREGTPDIPVELALHDPGVRVIDAENLARRAISTLVAEALRSARSEETVVIRSSVQAALLRLSIEGREIDVSPIARELHRLGGDAGTIERGELIEAYLELPLA